MKKALNYHFIAIILAVIFGSVVTVGLTDMKLGQLNTVGSSPAIFDIEDVHNRIIDKARDIAICTQMTTMIYNDLNPQNNIEIIKAAVHKIEEKKDTLLKIINTEEFANFEDNTYETFNNDVVPALDSWLETYNKAIAYFEEKEFTHEAIGSFKGVINLQSAEIAKVSEEFLKVLESHGH